MTNKIKVLSLFDGISGARQALKELNIDCEYFSSEIDKYAIQIAKANHPDIKHIGNVKHLRFAPMEGISSMIRMHNFCDDTAEDYFDTAIYNIDLMVGGFPCQSFSIAGNRKGLEDDRGQLFFDLLRILDQVKPKYFLFENVASMSKANQAFISEKLGVEPIMINSALVTAQQRKRLYWTNIPDIQQPKDKEIYLKDIVEDIVDEKYFIRNATLTLNDGNANNNAPIRVGFFNKGGQGDRVYSLEGKSVCLSANGGGRGAKTGLYAIAQRGRNIVNGKRRDIKGAKTEQRFETSYSEKSNYLTSVQKDSLLLEAETDNYIIRKLTVNESCRLQGFPDDYFLNKDGGKIVSNTQAYKGLGNGFTVPIIKHILQHFNLN